MDFVIETIQIIHNYPLGSEEFSYRVILHLEVIIDPGEIRSRFKCCYFIRQVIGEQY